MSLLLDALKKAAEQKAARQEAAVTPPDKSTDETIVLDDTRTMVDNTVAFDEDRTEHQEDETLAFDQDRTDHQEDETLAFDQDRTEYQADETLAFDQDRTDHQADETEVFDEDRTEYQEDETLVFEQDRTEYQADQTEVFDEDRTEYQEDETVAFDEDRTEHQQDETLETLASDESDISRPEDKTDVNDVTESTRIDEVDSDDIVLGHDEDATQLILQRTDAEDTFDNLQIIGSADQTDINDNSANDNSAEELTDDDVTAFLGEYDSPSKVSAYIGANRSLDPSDEDSDTISEATETESHRQSGAAESEDMPLTLMDMADPTSFNIQDSDATDTLSTNSRITDSNKTDADGELSLLANDSTDGLSLSADPASSDGTVTDRSVSFDRLTNEETVMNQDSTSTRTYAPDNYDRTLIKVDREDASQIFAGMKSDSDVLMTPDYAKRVFVSNSSAQRFSSYKIYFGVASVILIAIFIFGLFEYEAESINIDNSLRALKRDPMPILPKRSVDEKTTLFAQTDGTNVDLKTLALVESAGASSEIAPKATDVIADDTEVSGTIESGDVSIDESKAESDTAVENVTDSQVAATAPIATPKTPAPVTKAPVVKDTPKEDPQSFQVSSQNSLTDKDRLLKQAYAAYQSGDNELALVKYNQILADDPQNRNALLARAAINVQSNKTTDAIQDYQTLLVANPKDSLAMSSLISVASISPSKSESQLKRMIRDEPTSPHLNFALANVYGAQNRWREAQGLYFKALENNPNDPNYAYNLAVSLEHISKPKAAITYYQRALVNYGNGLATFNRQVVDQRVELLNQL